MVLTWVWNITNRITSSLVSRLPNSNFFKYFSKDNHSKEIQEIVVHSPPEAEIGFVQEPVGELISLKYGKTHYILTGPEDGPLIIFLHGVSLFSFVWNRLAQLLVGRGYRVLLFDFYGHGWSDIPRLRYSVDLLTEQLEELLQQLNLTDKKLILVGHSLGGLVASTFAARYKETVSRLILLNCAGLPCFDSFYLRVIEILRKVKWLESITSNVVKILQKQASIMGITYSELCLSAIQLEEIESYPQIPNESEKSLCINHLNVLPSHTSRFLRSIIFLYQTWLFQVKIQPHRHIVFCSIINDCPLLECDHSNIFEKIGCVKSCLFPDAHAEIQCNCDREDQIPVLILWGKEDTVTPPSFLDTFRKCIPTARIIILPECDHSMFLQKPSVIFSHIVQFIEPVIS